MPQSKRDKEISLTKVKKKGAANKQKLVKEIKESLTAYESVYVFTVNNMRNTKLKDIRQDWKDSRFFFGKNKVMAIAFGRIPQEEEKEGISKLSKRLTGNCGVLFTNRDRGDVMSYFESLDIPEFARSGNIATETVTLDEGPLSQFAHSMEPQLRKLGLPTSLERGVVTLLRDYTVCKDGDTLTSEQARILKLLDRQLVSFRMKLSCVWSKGAFENLVKKDKGGTLTSSNKKKNAKKQKSLTEEDVEMADDSVTVS